MAERTAGLRLRVRELDELNKLNQQVLTLTNTQRNLRKEISGVDRSTAKGRAEFNRLSKQLTSTSTSLKAARTNFNRLQKNVLQTSGAIQKQSGLLGTFTKALRGVGGALGLAFGAQQAFNFLVTDAIAKADEQIKAETRLATALGFTSDALLNQASALQAQTRFGDEATIAAQTQLATLGLTEKQILELTPLILDLSAATGRDLTRSTKEVVTAIATGSTTLEKYGVELSTSNSLTENLDLAISGLTESVGGQAVATLDGAGRLAQFSNVIGDFQENIGRAILEGSNPFIESLTDIVDQINNVERRGTAVQFAITAVQKVFQSARVTIEFLLIPLRAIISTFQNFGDVAVRVGRIIGTAFETPLRAVGDFLQNTIVPIFETVRDGIVSFLDIISSLGGPILERFGINLSFLNRVTNTLKGTFGGVTQALRNLLSTEEDVTDETDNLTSANMALKDSQDEVTKSTKAQRKALQDLESPLEETIRKQKEAAETAKDIRQSVDLLLAGPDIPEILPTRQIEVEAEKVKATIEDITPSFTQVFDALFEQTGQVITGTFPQLSDAFGQLSATFAQGSREQAQFTAISIKLAQAVAAADSIAALSAGLRGISEQSKQPFPANVIAITTTLATLVSAIASVKSLLSPVNLPNTGFAGGGFTKRSSSDSEVAGHVHANEYVAKASIVRSAKGRNLVNQLEGMRKRGFQEGGFTTLPTTLTQTSISNPEFGDLSRQVANSVSSSVANIKVRNVATETVDVNSRVENIEAENTI